ncbi:MAG: class I SAM-dependent methyltransferase [Terriglobales bacterium]
MGRSVQTLPEMPLARLGIRFLEMLLQDCQSPNFQVRWWDGSTWGSDKQPRFTLVINHPAALRAMLLAPSELSLGEAYIHGDLDIEGDVESAMELRDYLIQQRVSAHKKWLLANLLRLLPASTLPKRPPAHLSGSIHSKDRDRQAIGYHYDYPPEFYALWLDRHMVYSCAYFAEGKQDLDTAQTRKLDLICRKLRLRRGDRFLDIGCGWGGLVMHAAAHYGVQSVGITISVPQAERARQRIRESGLESRCRVEVCDYRDIAPEQPYDKIASVGMFEHVGRALLPEYFRRAWELLMPGGLFLNHAIASSATYQRIGPSFADRYVFPDGELLPLHETLRAAETSSFEVRDVESLREHYALTLRHWVTNLENHAEEARRITDETTYRLWRIYMCAAAHRFEKGNLNVYQTLLAKCAGGPSGLPLTREYLLPSDAG